MGLMTFGTVLILGDGLTSPAGSDLVAFMKDLDRGRGGANFQTCCTRVYGTL
jgi:hypothetical protein